MIDDTDDDFGAQTVSRRECEHGSLARKCEICELLAEIEGYQRHIAVMQKALKQIANPITYMQAEAKAEGAQLNGAMALSISESNTYLKDIAKEALKKAAGYGGEG